MYCKPTIKKRKPRYALAFAAALAISPALHLSQAHAAATYTTLHDFYAHPSGAAAEGGLVRGNDGAMYGTTGSGGASGTGTIFSVGADGSYHVLYNFKNTGDPASPSVAMACGPDGNLYGVSNSGGATDQGTLFRFNPITKTLTVLHSFGPTNVGRLTTPVFTTDGALYGSSAVQTYRWTAADGFTVTQNYSTALCDGKDGYVYGAGNGMLFKVNSAGKITKLHTFLPDEPANFTIALALGTDGILWGVSELVSDTIYRVSKTGQNLAFVTLSDSSGLNGMKFPISIGPDNRLYSCCQRTSHGNNGMRIFSVGVKGDFKTIVDAINGEQYSAPSFGPDGLIYFEAPYLPLAIPGGVFKTTIAGNVSAIRMYETTDVANVIAPPIKMPTGNYAGTGKSGGVFGAGGIYMLTPTGKETLQYNFPIVPLNFGEEYGNSLTLGADGNGYTLSSNQFCRLSPNGAVFATDVVPSESTVALSQHPIAVGADKRLYCLGSSNAYTVTPNGVFTKLTAIPSWGYPDRPVLAGDGNLYVSAIGVGKDGNLLAYTISRTGVVKTVSYPTGGTQYTSSSEFTAGPDGNLYGVSTNIYKIDVKTQKLTRRYTFSANSTWAPVMSKVLADGIAVRADGTIFGAAAQVKDGQYTAARLIYKISPTGVLSLVCTLPTFRHSVYDSSVAIKLDTDGSLIGVATGGPHGDGTLFRVSGI